MSGPLAADESGFTLIEMLVAILCAVVVIFGLGAILTGVLRGTQRTFTRVNATQHGRTAIANIENELHSACIGGGETPVQSGVSPVWSNATTLEFVSYFGATASPTPVWHVLTYNATAHTLTDAVYGVTGTSGNWSQGSLVSTNTVLTNVTQRVDSSGNAIPVFQYFAYAPGSSDSGGVYWFVHDGATPDPGTPTGTPSAAAPLTISGSGLTAAQADDTVEIAINLSVGADSETLNNPSLSALNAQIDDTISFRLTSPPSQVDTTDSATAVSGGSVPDGYEPCA